MANIPDDVAEIARRMKELGLKRDQPFEEPLAPDYHQDLAGKLKAGLGNRSAAATDEKPFTSDGYGYYG